MREKTKTRKKTVLREINPTGRLEQRDSIRQGRPLITGKGNENMSAAIWQPLKKNANCACCKVFACKNSGWAKIYMQAEKAIQQSTWLRPTQGGAVKKWSVLFVGRAIRHKPTPSGSGGCWKRQTDDHGCDRW